MKVLLVKEGRHLGWIHVENAAEVPPIGTSIHMHVEGIYRGYYVVDVIFMLEDDLATRAKVIDHARVIVSEEFRNYQATPTPDESSTQ